MLEELDSQSSYTFPLFQGKSTFVVARVRAQYLKVFENMDF